MKKTVRKMALSRDTLHRLDDVFRRASGGNTVDQSNCISCLMSGCPLTCDTICC